MVFSECAFVADGVRSGAGGRLHVRLAGIDRLCECSGMDKVMDSVSAGVGTGGWCDERGIRQGESAGKDGHGGEG